MTELRLFRLEDNEAAAALHRQCFADDPWPPDAFITLMSCQSLGFAVWEDTDLIGLIMVRPAADEAEILTFAVHPNNRRQGWGKTLLAHSMAALFQQKIARLFLEVAEDNDAARELYSHLGFTVVAERAGYYHDKTGPKTALVMQCNLAELEKK